MKPWGKTFWFYRGDGCEETNRPPRSLRLPRSVTTSHHEIGTRNPYPFLRKTHRTFRLPGWTGTHYEYEENESKTASMACLGLGVR